MNPLNGEDAGSDSSRAAGPSQPVRRATTVDVFGPVVQQGRSVLGLGIQMEPDAMEEQEEQGSDDRTRSR